MIMNKFVSNSRTLAHRFQRLRMKSFVLQEDNRVEAEIQYQVAYPISRP